MRSAVHALISRVGFLDRARDNLKLWRLYGTGKPACFTDPAGHPVFTDCVEPRGRALLRSSGRGQMALKRWWSQAISSLSPELVLDVGANYGEFAFLPDYAPHTHVLALEANPHLLGFLQKSHGHHPNAAQIEVICALLGARDSGEQSLFLDLESSGRSSAVRKPKGKHATVSVPCRSVDSLLAERKRQAECLVFKIDVEGHEAAVLEGMKSTLQRAGTFLGLVEFNVANEVSCPLKTALRKLLGGSRALGLTKSGDLAWAQLDQAGPTAIHDVFVATPAALEACGLTASAQGSV